MYLLWVYLTTVALVVMLSGMLFAAAVLFLIAQAGAQKLRATSQGVPAEALNNPRLEAERFRPIGRSYDAPSVLPLTAGVVVLKMTERVGDPKPIWPMATKTADISPNYSSTGGERFPPSPKGTLTAPRATHPSEQPS